MKGWRCRLGFHTELLGMSQARVFLRCVDCGEESPGWDASLPPLKRSRPAKVFRMPQIKTPQTVPITSEAASRRSRSGGCGTHKEQALVKHNVF
jgi:hypothetical protein